jgi:hypothetical protein
MDPEEMSAALKRAADIVKNAGLREDLVPIAFERVLDELGLSRGHEASSAHQAPSSHDDPEAHRTGDPLTKISTRLGIPLDAVEQVYEYDADAGLQLIIKRSMLPQPDQKAAAMRDIARLLAVGRQVAELEEYTPFSAIRDECAEIKVLDSNNFAAEIAKLEMRRRGSRNKQEVKANRHHVDETADLIRTIVAKGSP